MKNYIRHICVGIFLLTILGSCSFRSKISISQSVRNLKSHYNIFFHGQESLEEGEKLIETQAKDNYSQILPVYRSDISGTDTIAVPQMTRTIQKANKLVRKYSSPEYISTRQKTGFSVKKEYNHWEDDSYFIKGKALYYLHRYDAALNSFAFALRISSDPEIRIESRLWIIRCKLRSSVSLDLEKDLAEFQLSADLPKLVKIDFYRVKAVVHIKQHEYSEAILTLRRINGMINSRSEQKRNLFIIAQLYLANNQSEEALVLFNRIRELSPYDELSFQAELKSYRLKAQNDRFLTVKAELLKLLNSENQISRRILLLDLLAGIEQNEGNLKNAANYYQQILRIDSKSDSIRIKALEQLTQLSIRTYSYHKAVLWLDTLKRADPLSYEASGIFYDLRKNLDQLLKYRYSIFGLAGDSIEGKRWNLPDSLFQNLSVTEDSLNYTLLRSGEIFMNDLNQSQQAAVVWEALVRYGSRLSRERLEAAYYLWKINRKSNRILASYYRKVIESDYPESNYARYFNNPDFLKDNRLSHQKMEMLYEEAFMAYKDGNYIKAGHLASKIQEMNPESSMRAQIQFFKIAGEISSVGKKDLTLDLTKFLKDFPDSPVSQLGKHMLELVNDSVRLDSLKSQLLAESKRVERQRADSLSYYSILYFKNQSGRSSNYQRQLKEEMKNLVTDMGEKIVLKELPNDSDLILLYGFLSRKSAQNFMETNRKDLSTENGKIILTADLNSFFSGPAYKQWRDSMNNRKIVQRKYEDRKLLSEQSNKNGFINDSTSNSYLFVIAYPEDQVAVQKLIQQFQNYHRSMPGLANLKIRPMAIGNLQLMVVQLPYSRQKAMNYFNLIIEQRELYHSLENADYRNFIISPYNFMKLRQTGNMSEYMTFFRESFIH